MYMTFQVTSINLPRSSSLEILRSTDPPITALFCHSCFCRNQVNTDANFFIVYLFAYFDGNLVEEGKSPACLNAGELICILN